MGKKKRNSGKKFHNIDLRATNLHLDALSDQFGTSLIENDAGLVGIEGNSTLMEMGSTGPKGEKRKKAMADILESTPPPSSFQTMVQVSGVQSRHLCRDSSPQDPSCSSRVSWADVVELECDSPNSPQSHTLNSNSVKDFATVPLVTIANPTESQGVVVESDNINVNSSFPPLIPCSGTPVSNAKENWVSLFSDNRKSGCGLELNYIPAVNQDSVIFNDEEWNEGNNLWQFSLIGQVLGLNVKFKAMENYVNRLWTHLATPEVCLLKAGIFLFKFKSKNDMNDILLNGPWFFGSRPLLLKQWSVSENLDKISDCTYPLWIQLPELRLNLWNAKCISKIASVIGKPIATDKLTANRQRLAYARVLLEVTMPAPLPDQISIQGPNGRVYKQRVICELKPRWCNFCKRVGHDTNYCKRQPKQKWVPKTFVVQNESLAGNNAQTSDHAMQGLAQVSQSGVEVSQAGVEHTVHITDKVNDTHAQLSGNLVHVAHTQETESALAGNSNNSWNVQQPRDLVHVVHAQETDTALAGNTSSSS